LQAAAAVAAAQGLGLDAHLLAVAGAGRGEVGVDADGGWQVCVGQIAVEQQLRAPASCCRCAGCGQFRRPVQVLRSTGKILEFQIGRLAVAGEADGGQRIAFGQPVARLGVARQVGQYQAGDGQPAAFRQIRLVAGEVDQVALQETGERPGGPVQRLGLAEGRGGADVVVEGLAQVFAAQRQSVAVAETVKSARASSSVLTMR
jgi:hypothetical protein